MSALLLITAEFGDFAGLLLAAGDGIDCADGRVCFHGMTRAIGALQMRVLDGRPFVRTFYLCRDCGELGYWDRWREIAPANQICWMRG